MEKPIVVVGGGFAGLAAAALLARAGRRVTVYERARELGGRARTRHDGEFAFNQGAHALYAGGAGMRVLRELGIRPVGKIAAARGALAFVGGGLTKLPVGPGSVLSTKLFGWAGKLEAAKLLGTLGRLDVAALRGTSVASWLDGATQRPEVRAFVEAAVRVATYANAPEIMSAGVAVAQVRAATKPGVLYLDGGWGVIVDALAAVARAAGVTIVTGQGVRAIVHDARARGVMLESGEKVAASAVVVAASPSLLCALLAGGRDGAAQRYAATSTPLHAACLDLALSSLPRPARKFVLGVDAPVYFSVHSATAKLAPEGAALVHVMKYLDPRVPQDARADRAELEAFVDVVQPGWRDEVVHATWLPAMTVSHRLAQPGDERPPIALPDVAGVYLAGDGVGPVENGLLADASLASAHAAAQAILQATSQGAREVA